MPVSEAGPELTGALDAEVVVTTDMELDETEEELLVDGTLAELLVIGGAEDWLMLEVEGPAPDAVEVVALLECAPRTAGNKHSSAKSLLDTMAPVEWAT